MAGLLFFTIFIGAPLVELYLLIQVGSRIGALSTISLCLFTAALGGILVRWQGLSVLMRVRETLGRDEVPALELLEGAAILIAGVLLMLPGFVTDTLGFLLLVPPLRQALVLYFLRRRGVLKRPANVHVYTRDGHTYRVIEIEHRPDD